MDWTLTGKAASIFAVTNIDDIVVLAVFFGQAGPSRAAAIRVVLGQYVGFAAILAVSVAGALGGAELLPRAAIPYLGLLPLLLGGVRAAWKLWREHGEEDNPRDASPTDKAGVMQIATVTFANGGDNIGVYVPVFSVTSFSGMTGYVSVFLIGVAFWCLAGWYFARHPAVARILTRWGHFILPVVLIGIGW